MGMTPCFLKGSAFQKNDHCNDCKYNCLSIVCAILLAKATLFFRILSSWKLAAAHRSAGKESVLSGVRFSVYGMSENYGSFFGKNGYMRIKEREAFQDPSGIREGPGGACNRIVIIR
jgi:hypothetical protein